MKKCIGIAFLLTSASFFAHSNSAGKSARSSEVKPLDDCTVVVTFYDSFGNVTGSQTHVSNQNSYLRCAAWQNLVIFDLRNRGYRVEKQLGENVNINP